jgi:hypothetical protein
MCSSCSSWVVCVLRVLDYVLVFLEIDLAVLGITLVVHDEHKRWGTIFDQRRCLGIILG